MCEFSFKYMQFSWSELLYKCIQYEDKKEDYTYNQEETEQFMKFKKKQKIPVSWYIEFRIYTDFLSLVNSLDSLRLPLFPRAYAVGKREKQWAQRAQDVEFNLIL